MTDAIPDAPTFCVNHPQTPTSLRCNRCGQYICPKCAQRTPVGYRCRNCVRTQQQVFETAVWYDYALAVVVAAPLAGIAGFLVSTLGFFVIMLAPVAGGAIAEAVRFAVRRRRGRYLSLTAAAGFVAGCVPLLLWPLVVALLSLFGGQGTEALVSGLVGSLFSALWPLIYAVLGASTLYYRLRGISIN